MAWSLNTLIHITINLNSAQFQLILSVKQFATLKILLSVNMDKEERLNTTMTHLLQTTPTLPKSDSAIANIMKSFYGGGSSNAIKKTTA